MTCHSRGNLDSERFSIQAALAIDFEAFRSQIAAPAYTPGPASSSAPGNEAFAFDFGGPYLSWDAHNSSQYRPDKEAIRPKATYETAAAKPRLLNETMYHETPSPGRFSKAHAGLASTLFVYHTFDDNPGALVQAIGGYLHSVGASPWSENCAVLSKALHDYYFLGRDPTVLVQAIGTALANGTGPPPPATSGIPLSSEVPELGRRWVSRSPHLKREAPGSSGMSDSSGPPKRQRTDADLSEASEGEVHGNTWNVHGNTWNVPRDFGWMGPDSGSIGVYRDW